MVNGSKQVAELGISWRTIRFSRSLSDGHRRNQSSTVLSYWLHSDFLRIDTPGTGDNKLVAVKRGQKERETYPLKSTSAAQALNYGLYSSESVWKKCVYVVSESLDECLVDSWVFAQSPIVEVSHSTCSYNFLKTATGRIYNIWPNLGYSGGQRRHRFGRFGAIPNPFFSGRGIWHARAGL